MKTEYEKAETRSKAGESRDERVTSIQKGKKEKEGEKKNEMENGRRKSNQAKVTEN